VKSLVKEGIQFKIVILKQLCRKTELQLIQGIHIQCKRHQYMALKKLCKENWYMWAGNRETEHVGG
jgi:hypothetical protein